jgi:hypothetical protein
VFRSAATQSGTASSTTAMVLSSPRWIGAVPQPADIKKGQALR